MRTTVELPDDLIRRLKARAALEGRTPDDLIAEYVQHALNARPEPDAAQRRRSHPLPVIQAATSGKPIPGLSSQDLARFEDEEDLAKLARSSRK